VDGNFLQIWARLKRALVGGALGPIVRMMKVMEEVRLPVCYHTSPVNSFQPAVGAALLLAAFAVAAPPSSATSNCLTRYHRR
jgi:hypothetical protein